MFFAGATNKPQELDDAVLRRLVSVLMHVLLDINYNCFIVRVLISAQSLADRSFKC